VRAPCPANTRRWSRRTSSSTCCPPSSRRRPAGSRRPAHDSGRFAGRGSMSFATGLAAQGLSIYTALRRLMAAPPNGAGANGDLGRGPSPRMQAAGGALRSVRPTGPGAGLPAREPAVSACGPCGARACRGASGARY
jgi:hypothetical protein